MKEGLRVNVPKKLYPEWKSAISNLDSDSILISNLEKQNFYVGHNFLEDFKFILMIIGDDKLDILVDHLLNEIKKVQFKNLKK